MSQVTIQEVSGPKGHLKQRIFLVLGITIFVGAMQWCYVNWLNPQFGFYGFDYSPPGASYLVLAWILSLLPSLWMPLRLDRPSQLVYWMLYLTVFIPSMFVPLFVKLNEAPDVARLMVILFAGFAICGASYLRPLGKFRSPRIRRTAFWWTFGLLALACTVCVVAAYKGTMRLVSFADIYELREETIDKGGVVNYATMWLYGAIYPFLVGWGLHYKRVWLFVCGAVGQILIYSSVGTKASVLSVLFTLAFWVLLRSDRLPFALKLTWGVAVAFLGVAFSLFFVEETNPLHFVVASLVSMRTFGLPGLLTGQYYYFIHHNPLTYYGHIKGIGLFVHNPYHDPLGTVVGYYFYFPLIDATAHLWAADGLAAMGLTGVVLISVFCAFVFWILDSATREHEPRLVALVISYAALSICSIGIFTTLLSGGLGLLILLLYLIPPEADAKFQPGRDTAKQDIPSTCNGRELPEPG